MVKMTRIQNCDHVSSLEICPGIEIVSRDAWGARPPTEPSADLPDNLPMLFVHHSAMSECSDFESCSQAVRDIQDLHIDGNGWWDIGYR